MVVWNFPGLTHARALFAANLPRSNPLLARDINQSLQNGLEPPLPTRGDNRGAPAPVRAAAGSGNEDAANRKCCDGTLLVTCGAAQLFCQQPVRDLRHTPVGTAHSQWGQPGTLQLVTAWYSTAHTHVPHKSEHIYACALDAVGWHASADTGCERQHGLQWPTPPRRLPLWAAPWCQQCSTRRQDGSIGHPQRHVYAFGA